MTLKESVLFSMEFFNCSIWIYSFVVWIQFQTIIDRIDNKEIKFARISAKEYVYGRSSQKLKKELYVQKMRMGPSIDGLINNASITYNSLLKHRKGHI